MESDTMHDAEFTSQNADLVFSNKTPLYPLKSKQTPIQQVFLPVAQNGEAGDGYLPRAATRPASKRVFDICMALLLLMALAPLLLLVALAIKVDSPGPVLFKQPRLGLDNEVFWIWK